MSLTVRAIGPDTMKGSEVQLDGYVGTRPGDGRKPTTPQRLAGMRREPPRSLPLASGARPHASATAEPPEDPPAERARSHGLRVAPNRALTVFGPAPNSGVLVLPTMSAPACLRRAASRASSLGMWSAYSRDPNVVRIPAVGTRSLIPTGMPCSGARESPRMTASSASRAALRACSEATVQYAPTIGLIRSIRARSCSTSSTGEIRRSRIRRPSSLADANAR